MSNSQLFSSYQLGNITLKNRVVMAPMTRSRALQDNAPSELNALYYAQRAGAGLIITEGAAPSPNGLGYPRIPGIFNKIQIEGWKLVTDAVHKEGAKIFIQLMHTGRVGHQFNLPEGAEVVGPTAQPVSGEMYTDSQGPQEHTTPRKMTKEDISQAVEEFARAAKNSIQAGFDGVEIHGANGYLIEQFINPNINDRDDEYGGSVENRSRFVLEVAEAVVKAIGKERTGIRLSPYGVFNDTGAFAEVDETFEYLAEKLNELGLVYIHIVDHSAMGAPEVPAALKEKIRKIFKGAYILSGGYDKERAEDDLKAGKGDLVAFGRPFIANPDFVERMQTGAELSEADQNTFYTPGKEGYIDYPAVNGEFLELKK
ncbi:alkene reductase [Fulvivirga sp. 29W222]|uniref:Alkene reductase n=1 Tax=Fulvivirga marina TaxID=2494733 RepID=A0A937KCF5_9BACT|nr:alkene reductase [Fulvivirga marina]MBL6445188.1 alkene reductase [Fulvivirga marina]